MRYFVTGNCGFISSHLTERLLSQGHEVYGIDNLEFGSEENMNSFRNHENFKFFKKDFSDVDEMNDLISIFGFKKLKFDGVFHLGASARIQRSLTNPSRTYACNADGTLNILEMMRGLHIPRIVYSGSSSVYGIGDVPNRVSDKEDCLNPYSASKAIGEKLCTTWAKCFGIKAIVLRYFNVYGPREDITSNYSPIIGLFFKQKLK